jgi:hypothetical protein
MPPKKKQSNKPSNNTQFQDNISKWISITDQIISLESQLKKLREEQFNLSKLCVDQTSSISDINTILISNNENKTKKAKSKLKKPTETPSKKTKKLVVDNEDNTIFSSSDTDLDSLSSDTEDDTSSDTSESENSDA